MSARVLKIWNGRGYSCCKNDDKRWNGQRDSHAYVCAYSRADARRVIKEYCGYDPGDAELREYWSEGCWGTNMNGITPERGLWIRFGNYNSTPVRVV